MESSNIVHAENTEKRLESRLRTINFHRNITKVHKIMCFNQTKISTLVIPFDIGRNFEHRHNHTTSAKVWLTPTTSPRNNTTHSTRTFSQTHTTNVNRNNNGSTAADSFTDIPLEHTGDFENLFWMVTSKFISKDKKHFRS